MQYNARITTPETTATRFFRNLRQVNCHCDAAYGGSPERPARSLGLAFNMVRQVYRILGSTIASRMSDRNTPAIVNTEISIR